MLDSIDLVSLLRRCINVDLVSTRHLRRTLSKGLKDKLIGLDEISCAIESLKSDPAVNSTSLISLIVHHVPEGISLLVSGDHYDLIDCLCDRMCRKQIDIEDEMKLLVQLCLHSPIRHEPRRLESCIETALKKGQSLDTIIAGASLRVYNYTELRTTIMDLIEESFSRSDLSTEAKYAIGYAICSKLTNLKDHEVLLSQNVKHISRKLFENYQINAHNPMADLLLTMSAFELSKAITSEGEGCIFLDEKVGKLVGWISEAFWNGLEDRIEVERFNIERAYENVLKNHLNDHGGEQCGLLAEIDKSLKKRWIERCKCSFVRFLVESRGLASRVTSCYTDLVSESIDELCDRASAKQLSVLYSAISSSCSADQIAISYVLEPLVDGYNRSANKLLIGQLIFPKLFETRPRAFANHLARFTHPNAHHITIMAFMISAKSGLDEIDGDLLEIGLHSPEIAERADAFALLCALRPQQNRLNILFRFLRGECHLAQAFLRNTMVISISKLLRRLRSIHSQGVDSHNLYEFFVREMWQFALEDCLVDASYCQRNFGLRMIDLLLDKLHLAKLPHYYDLMKHKVVDWALDSYEDNRLLAAQILDKLPEELAFCQEQYANLSSDLLARLKRTSCPRMFDAISDLISRLPDLDFVGELVEFVAESSSSDDISTICSPESLSSLSVIRKVLEHAPIIITDVIDSDQKSSLIRSCFRIWEKALEVVGSDSPEGRSFTPMDFTESIAGKSSQSILVYSWRSVKEVSAILSRLFLEGVRQRILDIETLKSIWNAFLTITLTSRHHGAFEETHKQLVKVCDVLWRADDDDRRLASWPMDALNRLMAQFGGHSKLIQTTRRSGGLPLLIHALVSTAKVDQDSDYVDCSLVAKIIKTLTENVLEKDEDNGDNDDLEVHTLNIVRVLLRDQIRLAGRQLDKRNGPNLALQILPQVLRRLSSSMNWNIRNAASLLFKCIIALVFGTERDHSYRISSRNRIQVNRFRTLYPSHSQLLLGLYNQKCDEDLSFALLIIACHFEHDHWTVDEFSESIVNFIVRSAFSFESKPIQRLCTIAIKHLVPRASAERTIMSIVEKLGDARGVIVPGTSLILSLPRADLNEQNLEEVQKTLLPLLELVDLTTLESVLIWRVLEFAGIPTSCDHSITRFGLRVKHGELCQLFASLCQLPANLSDSIALSLIRQNLTDALSSIERLTLEDSIVPSHFAFGEIDPNTIADRLCAVLGRIMLDLIKIHGRHCSIDDLSTLCRICSFTVSRAEIPAQIPHQYIDLLFDRLNNEENVNENQFRSILIAISSLITFSDRKTALNLTLFEHLQKLIDSVIGNDLKSSQFSFQTKMDVCITAIENTIDLLDPQNYDQSKLILTSVVIFASECIGEKETPCKNILRTLSKSQNTLGLCGLLGKCFEQMLETFGPELVTQFAIELFWLLVPDYSKPQMDSGATSKVFEADHDAQNEFSHQSYLMCLVLTDFLSKTTNSQKQLKEQSDINVKFTTNLGSGGKVNRVLAQYKRLFKQTDQ